MKAKTFKVGEQVRIRACWSLANQLRGEIVEINEFGDHTVKFDDGSQEIYEAEELGKVKPQKMVSG